MKKVNIWLVAILVGLMMLPAVVWSQWCPNLNFGYGTFDYWQCYAGSCVNGNYQIQPTLPQQGRIDIMNAITLQQNGQFYDENFPTIPKVPDGFFYSCRIGNDSAGAKVNAIEYEMTVDSNSLLIVNFAWVMQNVAGHNPNEQPQFNVIIKDSTGTALSIPCGDMNFTAGNWWDSVICNSDSSMVALPWTAIGYNLEAFIGQKIKIYFETRDCTVGEHWSYAYVVAQCRPMWIELAYCAGMFASRIAAPEGFASYTWTRSSDTTWIVYTRQVSPTPRMQDGEILTCTLESKLGCETEIKTAFQVTSVDVDFMFGVKGTNGHVDFATHGNQSWYDTCSRTVTFVDMSSTVSSRKKYIKWEILGLPIISSDSMFTYTFPYRDTAVTYMVRLTVYAENGCADTSSQLITILAMGVGVEQLQVTSYKLQVYPNPTNGQLRIFNYELRENTTIEIYNVMGQKLLFIESLKSTETTIDVQHLASGMYFLKVGNQVVRFVKE